MTFSNLLGTACALGILVGCNPASKEDGSESWGSWTIQALDARLRLNAVDCEASTCLAVGDSGIVLRTTGSDWSRLSNGPGSHGLELYDVALADANTAYITRPQTSVWRTTDGGASWTDERLGGSLLLTQVHAGEGGVQGAGYALLCHEDCKTPMYAYVRGASGWQERPMTGTRESSAYMKGPSAFQFVGDSAKYVADGASVFRTGDGGVTWSSTGFASKIADLEFFGKVGYVSGGGGLIAKTEDGGAHWDILQSGTSLALNGLAFENASRGFAVGDEGLILATGNGGVTWVRMNSGTSEDLRAVAFTGTGEAYAVGDGGVILRFSNDP